MDANIMKTHITPPPYIGFISTLCLFIFFLSLVLLLSFFYLNLRSYGQLFVLVLCFKFVPNVVKDYFLFSPVQRRYEEKEKLRLQRKLAKMTTHRNKLHKSSITSFSNHRFSSSHLPR